ncbi:MAG TPA: orotidine-5'-phosphate decarboxylase [Patescibacteria group bacterium]|nr:orotidine-5'-phosphate decarboxylase [Patescibacteria group bacterium]
MKFITKLISRLESVNSHVCVGLDSRYDKIPIFLKKNSSISKTIFSFNKKIIEATHDIAVAYKSNVAFYAGFGSEGLEGLRLTNTYLKTHHASIPLFADCKRSEMGESVAMVKKEIFDWLLFDCVMVTPWFGFDTVQDYLDEESHGIAVYIHDSNKTAEEFQDLELKNGKKLYEFVAERVARTWNTNGNIIVEGGATYPKQLKKIREIVGKEMPILTAGIGIQGGNIEDLKVVFGKRKKRLLVNSSRGIIFPQTNKHDQTYFEVVRKNAQILQKKLLETAVS